MIVFFYFLIFGDPLPISYDPSGRVEISRLARTFVRLYYKLYENRLYTLKVNKKNSDKILTKTRLTMSTKQNYSIRHIMYWWLT